MNFLKAHARRVVALALVLVATLGAGCVMIAAGAAGAGTVAYLRGELDASLSHPHDAVIRAADTALQQMQFPKLSEKKDAMVAEMIARTAMDKRVVVTLNNTGENLTRVRIRVGTFGDESISRALLDRIKANL
jgi:hypothetical protein